MGIVVFRAEAKLMQKTRFLRNKEIMKTDGHSRNLCDCYVIWETFDVDIEDNGNSEWGEKTSSSIGCFYTVLTSAASTAGLTAQ